MPRTLLIADDHPASLEALEMLFRMRGYEVHTARDGAEAIELAHRVAIDVAVLDIAMPGRTGYEVAQEIRRLPGGRTPRLIAVTGFAGPAHATRAIEAGFDSCFIKPVNFAQLERDVAKGPCREGPSRAQCASFR
jgi:CheY-like chemotaxis protein